MKTLELIPSHGEFDALVTRVVDGDTIDCALLVPIRIRLAGIQTAERNTDKGQLVKRMVSDRLTKQVVGLQLRGSEKFGRHLAAIAMPDGVDLGEWLIGLGLAVKWDGKGPRPVGSLSPIEEED
ncbi:MAG TPA: hypothetical protein VEA69_21295 [Tepidisphaeraceae bacterium]|nr:hypothetical protein [Tepidisphaeraceae bacterium]